MSKMIVDQLSAALGSAVVERAERAGWHEARVELSSWRSVAEWLKDNAAMDHFIDLTAIDFPEREPDLPRFDVLCIVRSSDTGSRVHFRTRVEDGQSAPSLVSVWAGANWAEREVWDMFGIKFEGHPDLRRILMYDEFVGFPLRKDYPIDKAQPLVPYRDVEGLGKIAPFGIEEGQPWGRIQWEERLEGRDHQVSPAIAVQTGQCRMLSDSEANQDGSSASAAHVESEE